MADEIKGHPAWAEILNNIPAEYHPLVKPTLAKWDFGVTEKLESVRAEYEPYKKFIDNKVDPEFIENSIGLAISFREDPASVVAQAIETFELDYVDSSEVQAQEQNNGNEDLGNTDMSLDDLEQDPRFKALLDTVQSLQETVQTREQSEQEKAEQDQLESTLKSLEEDAGSFDRLYVMALMAQGIDGPQAVKQYQDTINQAVESKLKADGVVIAGDKEEIPVVMNGSGDAGSASGLPVEPVTMGDLTDGDVKKLVLEMIQSDATE